MKHNVDEIKEALYKHARGIEIKDYNMLTVGLYAFLSGFTPDITMADAFELVNDVVSDVLKI